MQINYCPIESFIPNRHAVTFDARDLPASISTRIAGAQALKVSGVDTAGAKVSKSGPLLEIANLSEADWRLATSGTYDGLTISIDGEKIAMTLVDRRPDAFGKGFAKSGGNMTALGTHNIIDFIAERLRSGMDAAAIGRAIAERIRVDPNLPEGFFWSDQPAADTASPKSALAGGLRKAWSAPHVASAIPSADVLKRDTTALGMPLPPALRALRKGLWEVYAHPRRVA